MLALTVAFVDKVHELIRAELQFKKIPEILIKLQRPILYSFYVQDVQRDNLRNDPAK